MRRDLRLIVFIGIFVKFSSFSISKGIDMNLFINKIKIKHLC